MSKIWNVERFPSLEDTLDRSNRLEVFFKRGVLENFAKITGKYLCQSFFFNKVAGLKPVNLFRKILWHRCFPVKFTNFLRTPFLYKTSRGCFSLDLLLTPMYFWRKRSFPKGLLFSSQCTSFFSL